MSGVRSGTHFISANYLAKFAVTIHKNAAPKASMTLVAEDSNPNQVGIQVKSQVGVQVKIGATVQVIDTSTDINDNLSLIRVNWGDNSSVTIMAPADTANHAYTRTGNKTITLTATDLKGLKSTVRKKITVIK
jgi:PKD repeat protein